jgi:hypothetical protein
MPNLALCTYELPGSRTCRQPRLRDEAFCRFHIRNHEAAAHALRMHRLHGQLEALDLPQLLAALRDRLDTIRCTLRCYPEAKLTLTIAIDRLNDMSPIESPMESMTGPQTLKNQSAPLNPNDLNDLIETLMRTMS